MLFNSLPFLFVFLPLVLVLHHTLGSLGRRRAAILALALASLVFYGWWDPRNLPILLASVGLNYLCGRAIGTSLARGRPARARLLLVLGIAGNVAGLGYYKYYDFVAGNLAAWTGLPLAPHALALPIGISFFTFTQIAYLVDCGRGETRAYAPGEYLLFVTYFPHLIAGPILLHSEMIPQFRQAWRFRFDLGRLMAGLAMFTLGLAKKLLLADALAPHADQLFDGAAAGTAPTAGAAALGMLAYALQLYFDFSGYADMAIGLSWLLGFRLPVNFRSPYRATSIIAFWRRWHVTLSRFLADKIYRPLGGNRRGPARHYLNLLATMLIGGIWHGAGWGFVLWGLLHGLLLVVAHGWRRAVAGTRLAARLAGPGGALFGWALTFAAVVLAWVPFRADGPATAWRIWRALLGANGAGRLAELAPSGLLLVALGLGLALLAPNSQTILRRYIRPPDGRPAPPGALAFRLTPAWTALAAFVLVVCIGTLLSGQPAPFLYFQF